MRLMWKYLVLSLLLAACSGYSAKDKSPRKGGDAAKDCKEEAAPSENDGGTDPWGDSYDLTQTEVNYEDIKPMLTQFCVSCHAGYDSYETAKEKIDTYIARVDLDESDTGFMPKGGSKFNLEDRSRLIAWKYSGFPQAGGSSNPGGDNPDNDSDPDGADADDGWTSSDKDEDKKDDCK